MLQVKRLSGWVTIEECPSNPASWRIVDWSEDLIHATTIALFESYGDALVYALRWAVLAGRKLSTPELFHGGVR